MRTRVRVEIVEDGHVVAVLYGIDREPVARQGCDRCYCGCKYWQNETCIDCGTTLADCLRDPEWVEDNRKEFVNPA